MDLDHDGTTTPTEVWFVSDHDVRPVTIGGRQFSEIFLLKDGLTVKTICPEGRGQYKPCAGSLGVAHPS
jgi:hypothetical protein